MSPQVTSRKCDLVEDESRAIEMRIEGEAATDMSLQQLGLCKSQDAVVHMQADEVLQSVELGSWALLNGGNPAVVARDVGSMARSTRAGGR